MPGCASHRRKARVQRGWLIAPLSRKISNPSSGCATERSSACGRLRPEDEPMLHDLAAHMNHSGFAAAVLYLQCTG